MARIGVSTEHTTADAKRQNLFRIGHILRQIPPEKLRQAASVMNVTPAAPISEPMMIVPFVIQFLEQKSAAFVAVYLGYLATDYHFESEWPDVPEVVEL